MPTAEEVAKRVADSDNARSVKRASAAKEVAELVVLRALAAEELARVEDKLGDALAAAQEVLTVDELARFTDVPAKVLARCLAARKPARGRRKRLDPTDLTSIPDARQNRAGGQRAAGENVPAAVS